MDLGKFYRLNQDIQENEALKKRAEKALKEAFAELVPECPHSESIDHKSSLSGVGVTRICKICGVEDHASEGGTPGDEYNYGYPGSPNRTFWKGSNVEVTKDEKRFWSFRRHHGWRVQDGKAVL